MQRVCTRIHRNLLGQHTQAKILQIEHKVSVSDGYFEINFPLIFKGAFLRESTGMHDYVTNTILPASTCLLCCVLLIPTNKGCCSAFVLFFVIMIFERCSQYQQIDTHCVCPPVCLCGHFCCALNRNVCVSDRHCSAQRQSQRRHPDGQTPKTKSANH